MAQSIFIALLSLEGRYMDSRQNAIIGQAFTFQWPYQHFPLGIYVHEEEQGLSESEMKWIGEPHSCPFCLSINEFLL